MSSLNARFFELPGIKGKTFVAGLFWHPLPSGSSASRKSAIEQIAEEQNFDLMVVRTTGSMQVGFTSSKEDAREGMLSVAAMVSKTMEVEGHAKSFLCALKVDNERWLYVAQRDGVILASGDMLGSEDQIRTKILHATSLDDWPTIYAPTHWNLPNSKERDLKSFLPLKKGNAHSKRWWGLVPVKRKLVTSQRMAVIAGLTAVVLLGAYGYSSFMKFRTDKELQEIAAQQAAMDSQVKPQPPPEHPWKHQALASVLAMACDTAATYVPTLWPANWSLSEKACTQDGLRVVWKRPEDGTIGNLLEMIPNADMAVDGDSASLLVPLQLHVGEDEQAPPERARIAELNSSAQRLGIALMLNAPPAPAPVLPGEAKPQQAPKDWKEWNWSVTGSHIPPSMVVPALDGNGFRVTRIQSVINKEEMTYNYGGIQYVQ